VRVIVRSDLLEFLDDRLWDDDVVVGETDREWVGTVLASTPETDEGGGIGD
jgi:hypothetical protein